VAGERGAEPGNPRTGAVIELTADQLRAAFENLPAGSSRRAWWGKSGAGGIAFGWR
jgi:hypothetical protein